MGAGFGERRRVCQEKEETIQECELGTETNESLPVGAYQLEPSPRTSTSDAKLSFNELMFEDCVLRRYFLDFLRVHTKSSGRVAWLQFWEMSVEYGQLPQSDFRRNMAEKIYERFIVPSSREPVRLSDDPSPLHVSLDELSCMITQLHSPSGPPADMFSDVQCRCFEALESQGFPDFIFSDSDQAFGAVRSRYEIDQERYHWTPPPGLFQSTDTGQLIPLGIPQTSSPTSPAHTPFSSHTLAPAPVYSHAAHITVRHARGSAHNILRAVCDGVKKGEKESFAKFLSDLGWGRLLDFWEECEAFLNTNEGYFGKITLQRIYFKYLSLDATEPIPFRFKPARQHIRCIAQILHTSPDCLSLAPLQEFVFEWLAYKFLPLWMASSEHERFVFQANETILIQDQERVRLKQSLLVKAKNSIDSQKDKSTNQTTNQSTSNQAAQWERPFEGVRPVFYYSRKAQLIQPLAVFAAVDMLEIPEGTLQTLLLKSRTFGFSTIGSTPRSSRNTYPTGDPGSRIRGTSQSLSPVKRRRTFDRTQSEVIRSLVSPVKVVRRRAEIKRAAIAETPQKTRSFISRKSESLPKSPVKSPLKIQSKLALRSSIPAPKKSSRGRKYKSRPRQMSDTQPVCILRSSSQTAPVNRNTRIKNRRTLRCRAKSKSVAGKRRKREKIARKKVIFSQKLIRHKQPKTSRKSEKFNSVSNGENRVSRKRFSKRSIKSSDSEKTTRLKGSSGEISVASGISECSEKESSVLSNSPIILSDAIVKCSGKT
eukprot:789763_1